jgi:hypothetical protein
VPWHNLDIPRRFTGLTYTLDLPLVGLFLPFISSPTFHFWDPTRVYLISGVFFLSTEQPGFEGWASKFCFGSYIQISFRQELLQSLLVLRSECVFVSTQHYQVFVELCGAALWFVAVLVSATVWMCLYRHSTTKCSLSCVELLFDLLQSLLVLRSECVFVSTQHYQVFVELCRAALWFVAVLVSATVWMCLYRHSTTKCSLSCVELLFKLSLRWFWFIVIVSCFYYAFCKYCFGFHLFVINK